MKFTIAIQLLAVLAVLATVRAGALPEEGATDLTNGAKEKPKPKPTKPTGVKGIKGGGSGKPISGCINGIRK
ncbi:hypothetical protein H4R34_001885 [Dimargaris verticillata]|uniref:Uncharacterized protein n=1 Tax=Dimargaris verticillata TaxID=2761393 RepID=A0A9W8EAH7_9FUNG|nr:hypothetical protein H4R34_001885 [Dimargaris verticillata]